MNVALTDTAHREAHFEAYIVQRLAAQGWKVGDTSGYDQNHALYPEDLTAWLRATQPAKWERLVSLNGTRAIDTLMARLADALERAKSTFNSAFLARGVQPRSSPRSSDDSEDL